MNNFFKQLLGSLVQIGINELSKSKADLRPRVRGRGLRQSGGLSGRDERSEVTEMDVIRIGEGVKQEETLINPSAYGSSPQKGSQENVVKEENDDPGKNFGA